MTSSDTSETVNSKGISGGFKTRQRSDAIRNSNIVSMKDIIIQRSPMPYEQV
jgi:hypothetical protein